MEELKETAESHIRVLEQQNEELQKKVSELTSRCTTLNNLLQQTEEKYFKGILITSWSLIVELKQKDEIIKELEQRESRDTTHKKVEYFDLLSDQTEEPTQHNDVESLSQQIVNLKNELRAKDLELQEKESLLSSKIQELEAITNELHDQKLLLQEKFSL
jgi:hypothetical protein